MYLYQKHGDLVTVPPGWWHQVINSAPCVKVAWDKWDPNDIFAYMQAIQLLSAANCLAWLAHDYQSVEPVLVEGAAKLMHEIRVIGLSPVGTVGGRKTNRCA